MSRFLDPSFDLHPKTKGSYRRRAEDIHRALQRLRIEGIPEEAAFLIYYFACEKLAKIVIGISTRNPASNYFGKNYSLHIDNIITSCEKVGIPISQESIQWIFTSNCDDTKWKNFLKSSGNSSKDVQNVKSARWLRNKMVHDIGPTHAMLAQQHAGFLISEMKKFLGFSQVITGFLASSEKHVS